MCTAKFQFVITYPVALSAASVSALAAAASTAAAAAVAAAEPAVAAAVAAVAAAGSAAVEPLALAPTGTLRYTLMLLAAAEGPI
jgi:septal ring-binding cell division protein DamX